MDGAMIPCSARRVPKHELDRATTCLANAEYEAAQVVARTTAQAEVVEAGIADCMATFEDRLRAAEETEFRAFLDTGMIARRAVEAVDVLDQAARIGAEFDAVVPWLTDLVATCLRKIIGQLDPGDVLAATLGEAVSEMKAKSALGMRVASADHAAIKALVAAHPERFAAVESISPDADLPKGTIYLEGKGGYANIGTETQIAALRPHLERLALQAVAAK
jgi:flagellar biosynthesis/type III secretory pathway protein FliH